MLEPLPAPQAEVVLLLLAAPDPLLPKAGKYAVLSFAVAVAAILPLILSANVGSAESSSASVCYSFKL